jgi:diphosphomevalonate decarboxylase
LPELTTTTIISESEKDEIVFANGNVKNIQNFLNLFRKIYGIKKYFRIQTSNNFPTAAGLASSSSGFAALAKGLDKICGLNLRKKELSILARQGSGSACRSIYDGFVLWHKGEKSDGLDSYAQQLFAQNYWPEFCVLIVVVDQNEKKISSRQAMQITTKTSPFYKSWLQDSQKRIPKMIDAIKKKDFSVVGQLAQMDCLGMHKTIQTSVPSINYWQQTTLKVMKAVKSLRKNGLECFFTIDAGPNVKILCLKKDALEIKKRIKAGLSSKLKNVSFY